MSLSVPICKMGVTSEVREEAEFRIVSSEVSYFLSLTNGLGKHLVRMFLVHPEGGEYHTATHELPTQSQW